MSRSEQDARKRIRLMRVDEVRRCCVDCSCDVDIVQQQFADEVDINTIVRRFGTSLAPPPVEGGVYGDFTGITSFEDALDKIERAQADFLRLPPEVRERYGNDPGRFLREADVDALADELVPEPGPLSATLDDVLAAVKARPGGEDPPAE